jgi:hypothetical protein
LLLGTRLGSTITLQKASVRVWNRNIHVSSQKKVQNSTISGKSVDDGNWDAQGPILEHYQNAQQ